MPSTLAVWVRLPEEPARAMPKSTTFTPPSSVIMMFPGLMSRCTSPAPCATASASQTAVAMPTARSTGRAGCCASRAASERPLTSSMTMNGVPSSTPESKTITILGCTSIAACCASRLNRSAKRGSSARPPLRTFTATWRPSTRSTPRQTVAMPPTPSIPTSSYRPFSARPITWSSPHVPCPGFRAASCTRAR